MNTHASQPPAPAERQDHTARPLAPRERIVVAGGTGFIGRALCSALVADGHDVVVLSRADHSTVPGTRAVRWSAITPDGATQDDATPDHAWLDALDGARAVVNLCGSSIAEGRWSASRKRELIDSRTRPAQALLAAIARLDAPPALLLQASGVGYVGTADRPTDETAPPGGDFLAQLAVEWEATLQAATVPTAALRFGVVLGHSGALPRMLLPFRLYAGGPIGTGQQWLSWIHIDDAVAAIRFAIEHTMTGPINVTAPEPLRNRDFAAVAGRVLGRPTWLKTPAFALHLALGEQASLVCEGQQALPARLLAAGFRFRYPMLESALRALCA